MIVCEVYRLEVNILQCLGDTGSGGVRLAGRGRDRRVAEVSQRVDAVAHLEVLERKHHFVIGDVLSGPDERRRLAVVWRVAPVSLCPVLIAVCARLALHIALLVARPACAARARHTASAALQRLNLGLQRLDVSREKPKVARGDVRATPQSAWDIT